MGDVLVSEAGRASSRRLIIALGASVLVHYVVAGAWRGGAPQSAGSQTAIAARLEAPADAPLLRDAPGTGAASPPAAIQTWSGVPQLARHALRPAQPAVAAAQPGPDHRVYLARELDRYPAPVAALSLDAGAGGASAGSVRLWVSIDQAGQVTDIAVIDAEPPAAFDAVARERLLGMRFSPAYKDDRPVKSRVLLVLNHGL